MGSQCIFTQVESGVEHLERYENRPTRAFNAKETASSKPRSSPNTILRRVRFGSQGFLPVNLWGAGFGATMLAPPSDGEVTQSGHL
jgi:hypothetical protein